MNVLMIDKYIINFVYLKIYVYIFLCVSLVCVNICMRIDSIHCKSKYVFVYKYGII